MKDKKDVYFNNVVKNFAAASMMEKKRTGRDPYEDAVEYFEVTDSASSSGMSRGVAFVLYLICYAIGYLLGIYLIVRWICSWFK